MTEIEEKSIKVQLTLSKAINSDNNMIIYHVQDEAKQLVRSVLEKHMTYDKESITLSIEEYTSLSKFINRVSSDEGMKGLCDGFCKNYIESKSSKETILKML